MSTSMNDLTLYINELDKKILDIDKRNKNEESRHRRVILKCRDLLNKDILSIDDLSYLNHFISFSIEDIFKTIPNLFSIVVDKIELEYMKDGIIREELLTLLESIISKEDFSLFESDENIDAFKSLYKLSCTNNISLIAILNYLTDYSTIISFVGKCKTADDFKSVSKCVSIFCRFLTEEGYDISISSPKIFQNQIYRQIS